MTYDTLKVVLLAAMQEEYIIIKQRTIDEINAWERQGLTPDEAFRLLEKRVLELKGES